VPPAGIAAAPALAGGVPDGSVATGSGWAGKVGDWQNHGRLFKWRQSEPTVILMAVGWYLRFSLSYRDVEELLVERGLDTDHVTVWRWVQRYAPELERRLRGHSKSGGILDARRDGCRLGWAGSIHMDWEA
jgi:hypothetical protein